MVKPKAIFFDFDGTLLSHGVMTKYGEEALLYAKEKGALIFAATGRHKNEVDDMLGPLAHLFSGYVTMNGAYCYVGDTVVFKKTLHKDTVSMMLDYIAKTTQSCMFADAKGSYVINPDEKLSANQASLDLPVPPERNPTQAIQTDVYKMFISEMESEDFIRQLPHTSITSWGGGYYDICPEGVNKWTGILPVLDYIGLTPHEIAAVGDYDNDIEMLQGAGFAVAMGNGPDRVKAYADYVTGHIDDGGALEAVKWLLG